MEGATPALKSQHVSSPHASKLKSVGLSSAYYGPLGLPEVRGTIDATTVCRPVLTVIFRICLSVDMKISAISRTIKIGRLHEWSQWRCLQERAIRGYAGGYTILKDIDPMAPILRHTLRRPGWPGQQDTRSWQGPPEALSC
jgi:hypothetical protein